MTEKVQQGFRLSPQQERVWRLQAAGPGPYRAECLVRCEGDLDPERLRTALQSLVDRHEILRTGFWPSGSGSVTQVIHDHQAPGFRVADLSSLAGTEQAAAAEALWEEERVVGFDLERGPVLKALLALLGDRRYALWLGLPGLCADAAGLENLIADLARSYAALRSGQHPPGEPVQYPDVAEVLNDLLESEDTRRGQKYWDQLGFRDFAHPRLPYEMPGSEGREVAPRTVAAEIEGIVPGLEALAQEAGASLEAVLLAIWEALLCRLAGGEEIVVGVASDGRSHEDLRDAVGLLARYLPVRARVRAGESFRTLAAAAATVLREGRSRQDFFSWEEEPGSSFLPYAFELLAPAETREAGGVRFTTKRRVAWIERFKVLLALDRRGPDLGVEVLYDASGLSEDDAERILGHFRALLADLAARGPETAVGELEILPPTERRRLLTDLNGSSGGYENDLCLHEHFERQAARSPEAVALEFEGGSLTYGELDARANRIARFLGRLERRPEASVAVCAERSPEAVAALLGILKAGCAYVPLDPSYPQDRLGAMLADSGASVLLTLGEPRIAGLDELDIRVVPLEAGRCPAEEESGESLAPPDRDPRWLAYVIYTSGSTGRPKGVMVSHRAICNRLLWMRETFPLAADDRVLQKTSLSFDASIWELFSPLIEGARVFLARPGGQQDAAYLVRTIAERQVTVLQLVPSFLRIFLEEPGLEELTSLRRLFSGGEALPAELVEGCRRRLVQASLCNLYGPTESAIDATCHPCVPGEEPGAVVAIGRPVSNVQLYLLDGLGRPVPFGVPGELHIGGDSLARGYLGAPRRTAEAFLPDPFHGEPDRRLYRTGDLGRYRPDGEIEYLGRLDHQVKLRGYRIELGEIESALRRCPGVREAVVAVRQEEGGSRLVAYVVPAGEPDPDPNDLRRALERRLPEYMVPSAFVTLAELPLAPNGKLDRGALPSPGRAAGRRDAAAGPLTPTEEVLTGIWCEVLGAESVGLQDDFFESGGHSLLAMRVISRAREAFGVEVEVRDLFEEATVAGLSQRIDRRIRAGEGVEAPPVERAPRDRPLPLSFPQQRLWFLDQLKPGGSAYNLPSALRLEGPLDPRALHRALQEIVQRHEALRTTFRESGGGPVQVVAPAVDIYLPAVDLRELPAPDRQAEAQRLANEEAGRPFDLGQGPLLRVRLLRMGDEDHVVLATLHHIVSDGWSMGVFIDEMMALYGAFRDGRSPLLPELPVQYADYAVWQRNWLQGEVLEAELAYWRRQLAGAPPVLELPLDRPRPTEQTFAGADFPFFLPPELSEAVRTLARRQGASVFMVLLAAFGALLGRYAGQEDVVVGTPIANRTHRETEGLIGFFVNTLVLRSDLSGAPSFQELLARVRRTMLEAFAHPDVPFERLVEELRPDRDLARTPVFQVVFALQNMSSRPVELPGLRTVPFGREVRTTKFDLTLVLTDSGAELQGALEYNTDLFLPATAHRLVGHFGRLLRGVTAHPEMEVAGLPLVSEAERHQVLREWNEVPAAVLGPAVHERLAAHARRSPESLALAAGEQRWSYGELDRQANRLAHHLRALGARPGALVALLFDRSPELVLSALGVLKAGAAYLPLDPNQPRERLEFMLADSGAAFLITRGGLAGDLPMDGFRVVLLDADREEIERRSDADPGSGAGSGDLAYVIYTSGSTGRPKGAGIPHGGLANLVDWHIETYGVTPEDRGTLVSSVGFDASVWDIWAYLSAGASLWIPVRELLASPAELLGWMAEQGITLSFLPTPLAIALLDEPLPAGLALRGLLAGGDRLTRWKPDGARFGLFNIYGPTECSVVATFTSVGTMTEEIPPSIGRPLSGGRVYLLDAALQPVPAGVRGDLYIGGAGVGRGYLGHPGLTAGAFIPDPWSGQPGARLYRTGDLARHRADGSLEFLGRTDHQVKLRGFRIELGEIESVLSACPGVREAVVHVWDDGSGRPGGRRLVAYLSGDNLSVPALRERLKERLPEYMVPSSLVVLPALPLTPNGKVDRAALPDPGAGRSHLEGGYAAPRDVVEELVAEIWGEVLGFERVGIHDDFFDLGGHSLLVMQVVLRLREALEIEIPVREVFTAPTVAELAGRLPLYETQPGQVAVVAAALQQVRGLSPEELTALLEAVPADEGEE